MHHSEQHDSDLFPYCVEHHIYSDSSEDHWWHAETETKGIYTAVVYLNLKTGHRPLLADRTQRVHNIESY